MAERYTAILKWMGGEEGYGFMVEQDGHEVFVCYEPLAGETFRILMEGVNCDFEIEHGRKGLTAANINQLHVPAPMRYSNPRM